MPANRDAVVGEAVADLRLRFPADASDPATKELLGRLQWLADLGIDTVIGRLDGDDPRAAKERLAQRVIPAGHAIETRR